MPRQLDADDPRVQAMGRVPMPADRKARRRHAVEVCVTCLATAFVGWWFIPGVPYALILFFDTFFWIGAIGLLWMAIAWVWWWLGG